MGNKLAYKKKRRHFEIERNTPAIFDSLSVVQAPDIWLRRDEGVHKDTYSRCMQTPNFHPKTVIVAMETVLSGGLGEQEIVVKEDTYEQICEEKLLPIEELVDLGCFHKNIRLFRKVIVCTIDIYKILPHLWFVEYPAEFRNIAKQSVTAAVELLLDQIVYSSVPKHKNTFIAALKECGYKHIAILLKVQCTIDKSYQSRYIAIMLDTIKSLIAPETVAKYLMSYGVLHEQDVFLINNVHSSALCDDGASILLLETIQSRHSRWYSLLVLALKQSGQTCAVEILDIPELQSDAMTQTLCRVGLFETDIDDNAYEINLSELHGLTSSSSHSSFSDDTECVQQIRNDLQESTAVKIVYESNCPQQSKLEMVCENDIGTDLNERFESTSVKIVYESNCSHQSQPEMVCENDIGIDLNERFESTSVKIVYESNCSQQSKPEIVGDSVSCNGSGTHSMTDENYYESSLPPKVSPRDEQDTAVARFDSNASPLEKEENVPASPFPGHDYLREENYEEALKYECANKCDDLKKKKHVSFSSVSTTFMFTPSDEFDECIYGSKQCIQKDQLEGRNTVPATPASYIEDFSGVDEYSSKTDIMENSGSVRRNGSGIHSKKDENNYYPALPPEVWLCDDHETDESVRCNGFGTHSTKDENYYESVLPLNVSPRDEQDTTDTELGPDPGENLESTLATPASCTEDFSGVDEYSSKTDMMENSGSVRCNRSGIHSKKDENNFNPALPPDVSPCDDQETDVTEDYIYKPPHPLPIEIPDSDDELLNEGSTDEHYDADESAMCNRPGTFSKKDENYYDPVCSSNESPRDEQETCVKRDYIYKPPCPLPRETNSILPLSLSNEPEEIPDDGTRPTTRTDTANKHKDSGHLDVFRYTYLETGSIDIKRIHALSFEEIEKYVQNVQNERAVHKTRVGLIQQLTEELQGLSSDKDTMIHYKTQLVNVDKRLKTQQCHLEGIAADQEDIQNTDVYPSNGIYSAKQMEIQNNNMNGNVGTTISDAESVLKEKIYVREKKRMQSSRDSAIYSCSQSQMYPIMEAHEQD